MSTNDDYIAKLDLLKTIEEKDIQSPTNVPVDEIRKFGQFVFWRDEKRKRGYISNYLRYRRMKREKAAADTAVADVAVAEAETA